MERTLELELAKLPTDEHELQRTLSPNFWQKGPKRYARLHQVRYVARSHDKSSNRHCSGNKVCRVCHEAWGSVGVSGNRRTPGGRSVEQVLTLLIVEELALIGMFRRMAQ